MQKLRGVNLGGWLLVEDWMTPSLFTGTSARDEYMLMLDPDGPAKLAEHQREFITEEDFRWMSLNGINAVRIPIGYWIIDSDDPYRSCIERLDWAVKTAKKYSIYVLICMHGAPGSQNGRNHSGRVGRTDWYRSAEYREQTIEVLCQLAERYYHDENVWGIELLNEPKFGLLQWKLRSFYRAAYKRLARIARPGLRIVFHDAFTPRLMSGALLPIHTHPPVLDIHWYHFGFFLHRWVPIEWYYHLVRWHGQLIRRLSREQSVIVGEWSMVISTDAFRRYPQVAHQPMMDEHARLQLAVYDAAAGWFYWTYKTEGRGLWNFRSLVEDGRITLS